MNGAENKEAEIPKSDGHDVILTGRSGHQLLYGDELCVRQGCNHRDGRPLWKILEGSGACNYERCKQSHALSLRVFQDGTWHEACMRKLLSKSLVGDDKKSAGVFYKK